MSAAEPERLRLPLTQPQAVGATTVLEWRPRADGAHWPDLHVPVLFVQGDRDGLCELGLLERERRRLLGQVPSRVHVLPGADHTFRVRGRGDQDVLDEVAAVVAGWLASLP